MHNQLSKKDKELVKRIAVYAGTTLSVIIIVVFVVFFVLGYRFDSGNGRIEQYALLQFSSSPSGATVVVDGKALSSQTPNKSAVPAGKHTITISKSGYQTWQKTINIKSGILEWLNYALLVPKKLSVESVTNYESIDLSLASPGGHYMLVQERADTPSYDLVDLSSDVIKTTKLTIPADVYSDSATVGVQHNFQIEKWDDSGRYVLIKHTYGDQVEWLVLDTQDVKSTKNITHLFDFVISSISFSGMGGNSFYVLGSGDIRKLDLSAGTISRPLINNVTSFSTYGSDIITYVGTGASGTSQQVVGIYRDGDEKSYIIKTINNTYAVPINIAAARYFNEDYVAISEGNKVDILSGSFPNTGSDKITSLKELTSLTVNTNIQNLSFSPTGEYVFMQSGAFFASYDLEYQSLISSSIDGNGNVAPVKWLNDNYILSDRDGSLTIREFDGANIHTINPVQIGQDAVLSSSGRYIYSFNKSKAGYQLQRVRMVLP
jgi:hypothetical protein